MKPYYKNLSPEEIRRNVRGEDRLYVGSKNEGYNQIRQLYVQKICEKTEVHVSIQGMQGTVLLSEECVNYGSYLDSPVIGLDGITNNTVCCVKYRDPKYAVGFIFPAKKLKGAVDPPRVLKPFDLDPNSTWRPIIGMVASTTR